MLAISTNLRRAAVAGAAIALTSAGSAWAFQALPSGGQVNDDIAAGINKTISVSGEDPANADVVGGALTAGKVAIPWAVFRQGTSSHDQVFSRSFEGGIWITRGAGTVGGRSSASPSFEGSLNFDQGQDGEAPAIDFAGNGRTVPWATWYENTAGAGFAKNNIFASRFDDTGDANQGKWIFSGQSRGTGGGSVPVPSLNIHTDQDAENPSVAGGSAVDPTKPTPWVSWQETTSQPVNGKYQIFVARSIGPGAANCDGVAPEGEEVGGQVPAVGGFCWQQTGIARVGPGAADPSLNVDPTRDGVEPDVAFTGPRDGVPWVVWYEMGQTGVSGLNANSMIFAARALSDGAGTDGGFHWEAVGSGLNAALDGSGAHGFGLCAESATNEGMCSLNANSGENAEDPRVAAGTMDQASPTVPWVVWNEDVAGIEQVFVSRLVGTGTAAHFALANGGKPISVGANDSTRPDITFSGNTPYVSWRQDVGGGVEKGFFGHFENPENPTFVLDESDVPLTSAILADVREPISSSCIATPFDSDGAACAGGAVGTPFSLFTNGTSPRSLFANAYQPDGLLTGNASAVSSSSATLLGEVNPEGASVRVSFQYGTTPAYGQTTVGQSTGTSDAPTPFAASLSGLPAGTTIHYRAVAVSDFGTFAGADRTLTTVPSMPPLISPASAIGHAQASVSRAKVSGSSANVRVSCAGPTGTSCAVAFKLTVTETLDGRRLVSVAARLSRRKTHKVVVVGAASVSLIAGHAQSVRIALNRTGKKLLASRHRLKAKLQATQSTGTGGNTTISTQTITFKAVKRRRAHSAH